MLKKLDLKIRRDIDQSKYISFLIKDDELQENIIEFGKKVENNITKEFGSEPVYNEKYLKAKIKSCNGKINAYFHNNKVLNLFVH